MFDKLKSKVKKSVKSEKEIRQEYADATTGPYEEVRLDDPYVEEKLKSKAKTKPFYDRLKQKLERNG